MVDIRNNFEEFARRGARVAVIMAEEYEKVRAFVMKNRLPFPLLVDETRDVSRSYGTYVRLNFESVNISRQAEFVLDREGTVRFMYVGANQKDFVGNMVLYRVLDRLKEQEDLLV